MTKFIDVPALCRLVNRVGVSEFMTGMAATIREDFLRWEAFDKSARTASHSDVGVIELMPIADSERYGFKYVNGHPANTQRGLPTVMAFGALADVDTGYPTFIAELTVTTALRTAATSAIAASALARPNATSMGMIGCGAQSEFQALAFQRLLGIDTIHAYDIDPGAMAKLQRNLQDFDAPEIFLVDSPQQATIGMDIVTTCTADKAWATILTPDMVEPGMHINALGGDCPGKTELHLDVLKNAKIFVEYEPQTRIEGDIQQLPGTHPVHELWRVLAKLESGRDDNDQVTVFDSVGFALEDYSALRYLQAIAEEHDEGEMIALVPELADPKDLFELVMDPGGRAHARRVA